MAYTVLANRGSSLCICDALVVVHSLDLRRQYPEGTVAGQAFDRLHIELDMRNFQTKPEARFRASAGIEYNSFYRCAIYQVCRNFGRFFDRLAKEASWLANYFGDEPRNKGIPWIYRKMSNSDHIRILQVGHGKVEITTGDAGPESYTVRISIRFLISLVHDFMYSCVRISSGTEGDHDGFKVKQTPDDGPPVTLAGERFACVAGRIVRILNWSVADRNETRCSPVSSRSFDDPAPGIQYFSSLRSSLLSELARPRRRGKWQTWIDHRLGPARTIQVSPYGHSGKVMIHQWLEERGIRRICPSFSQVLQKLKTIALARFWNSNSPKEMGAFELYEIFSTFARQRK